MPNQTGGLFSCLVAPYFILKTALRQRDFMSKKTDRFSQNLFHMVFFLMLEKEISKRVRYG